MKLPHKWPGKARVIAALADMRMHGAVLRVVLRYAVYSRSQMKAHYPELRYWYDNFKDFQSTQRGKDNG